MSDVFITDTVERIAVFLKGNRTIAELDIAFGAMRQIIEGVGVLLPENQDALVYHFTRLKAIPEGVGNGTRVMRILEEILDRKQAYVICFPNAYGRLDKDQLIAFYEHFGFRRHFFVEEGGSENLVLIREPKRTEEGIDHDQHCWTRQERGVQSAV